MFASFIASFDVPNYCRKIMSPITYTVTTPQTFTQAELQQLQHLLRNELQFMNKVLDKRLRHKILKRSSFVTKLKRLEKLQSKVKCYTSSSVKV